MGRQEALDFRRERLVAIWKLLPQQYRKEAVARKVPVESLWMEKYGVQAARDKRSTEDRAAHEKKVGEEAVTKYRSEHPETNPLMAVPTISRTPFTGKIPSSTGSDIR